MELVGLLALVLVLFPAGVVRAVGLARWPRNRPSRLRPWHVRVAGLVILIVAVATALRR